MDVVEALHPQERVACFGDRPLRLRAYVSGEAASVPCVPEPDTTCIDGPAWLTGDGGWTAGADTSFDTPSIGGPPLAIDPTEPCRRRRCRPVPWSTLRERSITLPPAIAVRAPLVRMPPG